MRANRNERHLYLPSKSQIYLDFHECIDNFDESDFCFVCVSVSRYAPLKQSIARLFRYSQFF